MKLIIFSNVNSVALTAWPVWVTLYNFDDATWEQVLVEENKEN